MMWREAIPEIESGDLMVTIICFEARRFPLCQLLSRDDKFLSVKASSSGLSYSFMDFYLANAVSRFRVPQAVSHVQSTQ